MRRKLHVAISLWLGLATVALAHAIIVGGGVVQPLLLWQLHGNGEVDVGFAFLIAFIVLLGAPAFGFLLLQRLRRAVPVAAAPVVPAARRRLVRVFGTCAALAAILAGLGAYTVLSRPSADDPVVQIAMDTAPPDLRQSHAAMVGVPQPGSLLQYIEVTSGKSSGPHRYARSLMPLTATDWVPGQPVRVLMDLRGRDYREAMERAPSGEWITRPGYLLAWNLSGFERAALAEKGVVLADKVMVFSTDRMSAAAGILAFASICAIVVLVCLLTLILALRVKPRVALQGR